MTFSAAIRADAVLAEDKSPENVSVVSSVLTADFILEPDVTGSTSGEQVLNALMRQERPSGPLGRIRWLLFWAAGYLAALFAAERRQPCLPSR